MMTGLFVFFAENLLDRPVMPPFIAFVFFASFIFIRIWLIFGEMRTKVIKVEIEDEKVYDLFQFDGLEPVLPRANLRIRKQHK